MPSIDMSLFSKLPLWDILNLVGEDSYIIPVAIGGDFAYALEAKSKFSVKENFDSNRGNYYVVDPTNSSCNKVLVIDLTQELIIIDVANAVEYASLPYPVDTQFAKMYKKPYTKINGELFESVGYIGNDHYKRRMIKAYMERH